MKGATENKRYYEETRELEKWPRVFCLDVDIRKVKEDSWLNAI